jgi:hypothetical protein
MEQDADGPGVFLVPFYLEGLLRVPWEGVTDAQIDILRRLKEAGGLVTRLVIGSQGEEMLQQELPDISLLDVPVVDALNPSDETDKELNAALSYLNLVLQSLGIETIGDLLVVAQQKSAARDGRPDVEPTNPSYADS